MSVPARWPLALALVPLLLALGRPVAIDDTLFLRASEQILRSPLQPFGAAISWSTAPTSLWAASKNPPGLAYWLAAVEALGGASEPVLHLSLLPFAVAAALAGARLARRFTSGSPWVTAVWVASPAFLVSASTLMVDVPALALSLWGTALYIEGVDADRATPRRLGAFLAGLALVVKYTAGLALPTLVIYVLLLAPVPRRLPALHDLWPALVPSVLWGGLGLATRGRLHAIDSLWIADAMQMPLAERLAHHGIALLTFLAASGVFPLLFLLPAMRRPGWRAPLVAALLGIWAGIVSPALWADRPPWMPVVVGALVALGALALVTAGRLALGAARDGDREALFLAAWVGFHLGYVWFLSWTVAARFLLPLMPPLALLLGRVLRGAPGWLLPAATVATLSLSGALLPADGFPEAFHREVIAAVAHQAVPGRPLYFLGAWGFQYYAERAGMERLSREDRVARVGNLIVQPYYVSNSSMSEGFKPRVERVVRVLAPAPPLGLHTMNPLVGSGFYASSFGPLPFAISDQPATGVTVWRIVRDG